MLKLFEEKSHTSYSNLWPALLSGTLNTALVATMPQVQSPNRAAAETARGTCLHNGKLLYDIDFHVKPRLECIMPNFDSITRTVASGVSNEVLAKQLHEFDRRIKTLEQRCVTQAANGKLVLPVADRLEINIGSVIISVQNGHVRISGADTIKLDGSSTVSLASGRAEIVAGDVKVSTGKAEFSGTVKCDTVECDSVNSQSYTPGAGNVW